jgi:predicted anti-sigma-YlaC factor YlaD
MNEPMIQDTLRKDAPRSVRRSTAAVPRWVLITLAILLLGVVVFAILHFTGLGHGHGMGNMQMSIPLPGRFML